MIIPEEKQPGKYKFPKQKIYKLPQGLPIAWGEVIPPRTGRQKWKFKVLDCPYCGQIHFHGWPAPDDENQNGGVGTTRLSHCTEIRIGHKNIKNMGGEYVLLPKEYKPKQRRVNDDF